MVVNKIIHVQCIMLLSIVLKCITAGLIWDQSKPCLQNNNHQITVDYMLHMGPCILSDMIYRSDLTKPFREVCQPTQLCFVSGNIIMLNILQPGTHFLPHQKETGTHAVRLECLSVVHNGNCSFTSLPGVSMLRHFPYRNQFPPSG